MGSLLSLVRLLRPVSASSPRPIPPRRCTFSVVSRSVSTVFEPRGRKPSFSPLSLSSVPRVASYYRDDVCAGATRSGWPEKEDVSLSSLRTSKEEIYLCDARHLYLDYAGEAFSLRDSLPVSSAVSRSLRLRGSVHYTSLAEETARGCDRVDTARRRNSVRDFFALLFLPFNLSERLNIIPPPPLLSRGSAGVTRAREIRRKFLAGPCWHEQK